MEFGPSFFARRDEEPPKEDSSLISKVRNSKMARAGLVAIGLHGAALGGGALKEGIAHAAEVSRLWNDSEAVLRPQTDQQRMDVEKKMNERLARKNEKGLATYRQEAAKLLDEGKDLGFEELYFKQAELNGVSHEDIVKAQKEVEGLVWHFSGKLENGLTDDEIRDISRSMYDLAEYEWGQGSVVDYFTLHKRNCVSIEQAQTIVFERLFELLPEQQRSRYALGTRFENQHRVATVGISQSVNLAPERFILLQPPYETERAGFAPAGTAMASGEQVKVALVGKKVVVKSVEAKKGEEIHTGPRIDAEVNQPVDDGITVEGMLRSADANEWQAKREGVEPMSKKEYREEYQRVMEIDLLHEDPTELKEAEDQSTEAMEQRLLEAPRGGLMPSRVDLRDFSSPDAKSLREFLKTDQSVPSLSQMSIFLELGDLSKWNTEALNALADIHGVSGISVALDAEGGVKREFIQVIENMSSSGWSTLEIRQSERVGAKSIDVAQLRLLLKSLSHQSIGLSLDVKEFPIEGYAAIQQSSIPELVITDKTDFLWRPSNGMMPMDEWKMLSETSYALGHLKMPVFIGVKDIAAKSSETEIAYEWLFDAYSGTVFPRYSSLIELVLSGDWEFTKFGDALNSTVSVMNLSLEQPVMNPKALLLKQFVKGLNDLYKKFDNNVARKNAFQDAFAFYSGTLIRSSRFKKVQSGQGSVTSAELESLRQEIEQYFKNVVK